MAFAMPAAEVADAAAGKAAATAAGKRKAKLPASHTARDEGGVSRAKVAPRKAAPAPTGKSAPAPAKQAPAPSASGPASKKSAPSGGSGGPGLHLPRARKGAAWLMSGDIKLLTAEYIACVVVLGAGTLVAPQGSKDGTVRAMVKFTALSGLFFLLALVASAGKGAARGATALGALITAAYLFTSSDVHDVTAWTAQFFSPTGDVSAKQPAGSGAGAPGSAAGGSGDSSGGVPNLGSLTGPGFVNPQPGGGLIEE